MKQFGRPVLVILAVTILSVVLVWSVCSLAGCGLRVPGNLEVMGDSVFHDLSADSLVANDVETAEIVVEHVEAETVEVNDQLTVTGESDLGPTVFHGDVEIQGTLVVTEDLTVAEDINAGGEVAENVPMPLPPEDDEDDPLPTEPHVFSSLALLLNSPVNNGCYLINQNFSIAGTLFGQEGSHHIKCLLPDSPTQLIELDVEIDETGEVDFEFIVSVRIESQSSEVDCLASANAGTLYDGVQSHREDFDFAFIDVKTSCPSP